MTDNVRKVSFKNVGVLRFIKQGINDLGELEIDFDPDGMNSKAMGEMVSQARQSSVNSRDRFDELLVLVAQLECEISRHIADKSRIQGLLSACNKQRDKYKSALSKKRVRK